MEVVEIEQTVQSGTARLRISCTSGRVGVMRQRRCCECLGSEFEADEDPIPSIQPGTAYRLGCIARPTLDRNRRLWRSLALELAC